MSLVIFAMTAVVLGGAYVNVLTSYAAAQKANENDAAVSFARSQLLTQADLPTAQAGAEYDDGERHVKWSAEVDPADTTDLFTVTFTCVISGGTGVEAATKSAASRLGSARGRAVTGLPRFITSSPASRKAPVP